MPSEKRKIGDIGEKIAVSWLKDRGFSILDRNYLKKWGEIDIIAKKSDIIHFIEVKSASCENIERVGESQGYNPEDNVHPKKLERLYKTIETYISEKNIENDWEVGVAVVYLDFENKKAKVKFLENLVN